MKPTTTPTLSLTCLVLSFSFLFFFFFFSSTHSSTNLQQQDPKDKYNNDLIEKSCTTIVGYEDCVSILRSDPRSSNATSVKDLAYIVLDRCIANANDTSKEISRLQGEYSRDAPVAQALSRCAEEYEMAVKDYFVKAVELLGSSSYQQAQYSAHIGGAFGTGCEQEFYFQAPKMSPLWERNHDLGVLGLVAEGIVSLLRLDEF